jgi:ABC-2 type transport system permease protein
MFLFISKYEWLALKANKLLLLVAAVTAFVLMFALWDGYKRVSFQTKTIAAIEQQQKADYEKYSRQIASIKPGQHFDGGHFGDPTNPFYFGNRMGAKYAVLPPAPLSIISTGQSDLFPYYYKLTLSKRQALYHSEEIENPHVLYNGSFDLSFVIIFLLPLVIIAFTYNIYAAEKQNGTLQLLMAQNTSVQKITAYRLLFRYLLFCGFTTVILFTGLLSFGVNVSASFSPLAKVVGIVWLYAAFWFAFAFMINSFKKNAGFNATVLTGSWLLLVLIIPTILSVVVNQLHPNRSRLDLITKTRDISDSIASSNNVLNRFLEEHPEFKPAGTAQPDRNSTTLRSRIEVEMQKEILLNEFAITTQKREALVNRYRFFSPAIFLQQLLNNCAGTNEKRYVDFDNQVKKYHQAYRNYFEPLVYSKKSLVLKTPARFQILYITQTLTLLQVVILRIFYFYCCSLFQ